ncbi:hypothetical protein BKA70DRAFT_1307553 [Coprinopsis sp. MPI-PUGE-AT-0042]|nr:hypothetical protein BKA70DRAFT_1307553 [Coprinopsis sp. MPI-PUGE-AT-0042]
MADSYPLHFTPTFAGTSGAQLVATMVTTGLWGVATFMVAQYFSRHSQRDPQWTKALVASLGILVTLETIFANHQMYYTFVTSNNNKDAQDIIPVSMTGKTACIFLSAFLAQLFYASRIWKLGGMFSSRFRFTVIPIVLLAFLQVGGGMIQVVIMDTSKRHTIMYGRVWLNIRSMYLNGAATAACDILITIALVVILRSTDINATRRTKNLLGKLVKYTINRGIFTSAFALLSIFLYDFASGTFYYLIPFSSNTHIYIISVISMLTAREDLREDMQKSFHVSDIIMNTVSHKNEDGGETESSTDIVVSDSLEPQSNDAAS